MNGLERITSRIEAEAKAEADGIVDRGIREADAITASWRGRAEAEAREMVAKNEADAREREERLRSAAEMEARKAVLATKQELVEQAYARALDKLCAMEGDERVALLANLLARASSTGAEEAVFSTTDVKSGDGAKAVEQANAASGKKLTLSAGAAPIRGGFILRDKKVEVDCAFETLVRLQKTQTAGAVAKLLFPA